MTLKKRLYIGVGAILTLIVLILAIVLNMANQVQSNMNDIVKVRYEKVRLASHIRYEVNEVGRGLSSLVIEKNPENIQKWVDVSVNAHLEGAASVEKLSNMVETGKGNDLVINIKLIYEFYKDSAANVIGQVRAGKQDEAVTLLQTKNLEIRLELLKLIDELNKHQESLMDQAMQESSAMYDTMLKTIIAIVAVTVLIAMLITVWMTRSVVRQLDEVTDVMTGVPFGTSDKLPRLNVGSHDEIGRIAIAFNEMATALEERVEQENEYNQAMQAHSWLKTKLAEVTSTVQGVQDIYMLAHMVITKMTPLVGASYGVFYIAEEQGLQSYLKKLAAYADRGAEGGAPGFAFGQGLVGQAAVENKMILLEEVPDSYIQISSALGTASPASIIVLPIAFEGQVLAVIEMASFAGFSSLHQTLLEEVNDTIGVAINRIANYTKIGKLLKEAQAMTEELQSQSEELQLQQEELITINEQLEDQYKKSEQKSKELELAKLALEEKTREVVMGSKYKSEFLANMSHELRTPLNSLLILSQMLADNSDGNLTDKQVEFAQTVYSSGHDLLNLINDVLDLAKIEAGKMEIHAASVYLQDIHRYVERQFSQVAKRQGLEFTVNLADDLPQTFGTDEQRLQQVIKNLLSNAFKFTESGSVSLQIRRADEEIAVHYPELRSSQTVLAISVTDTGIGIAEENQEVIFEAFRQADGTTSRKYGGTGLGLSICREITGLLGGVIELDSVEGKGSTFTVYLPEHEEQEQLEIEQADQEIAAGLQIDQSREVIATLPEETAFALEEQPSGLQSSNLRLDGKKVLVVDDDMRNVFALTTALESHQIKVVFAENGREGIEMLEAHDDIDMVLMDIMMPEMDGYEAMRQIRQHPKYEGLPIIALTAKAMKNDREKCIAAGASDYISKPVQLEQLFSLMRVWMYR